MREAFDELRSAINQIEAEGPGSKGTEQRVRSLAMAVDHLRTKVWAYLTTHQEGDLNRYLAEVRVRRAREACEDVRATLDRESVAGRVPEIGLLEIALRELQKACSGLARR